MRTKLFWESTQNWRCFNVEIYRRINVDKSTVESTWISRWPTSRSYFNIYERWINVECLLGSCFIRRGRKFFFVQRNLFIQGIICACKKEITKLPKKLSTKTNLLVEFNREKCKLNYKSHVYIIKTMTETSTNTHLKVFIWL